MSRDGSPQREPSKREPFDHNDPLEGDVWVVQANDWEDASLVFDVHFPSREEAQKFADRVKRIRSTRKHPYKCEPLLLRKYDASTFPMERFFPSPKNPETK
jgi:hypothetical protein